MYFRRCELDLTTISAAGMYWKPPLLLCAAFIMGTVSGSLDGQTNDRPAYRRATPPDRDLAKPSVIFFRNAFAEALTGDRPIELGRSQVPPSATRHPSDDPSNANGSNDYGWSKIISATTLEDEIKQIKFAVEKIVTTPGKYASGGFKDGRRYFSQLAFIFAIVVDYEGEVRWKADAVTARNRFARAGFNSKIGTTQTYNEAKLRKIDLQDLVGGGTIPRESDDDEMSWDNICARPPLMQRLERAYQKGIAIWTKDQTQLNQNAEKLLHESEIMAAIATTISQEGFEFWDDGNYMGYCERLRLHALEVVTAVKHKNAQAARRAAGEIHKVCSECHEDYRG